MARLRSVLERYGDDTNDDDGRGAPMTLLRRVLGDTLRGRRLRQRRTLREVSGAARVSLGYLSEVERGQKEASSELLASICEALDVKLSDVLSEVSETMRRSERAAEVARMPGRVMIPAPARRPVPAGVGGSAVRRPARVRLGGVRGRGRVRRRRRDAGRGRAGRVRRRILRRGAPDAARPRADRQPGERAVRAARARGTSSSSTTSTWPSWRPVTASASWRCWSG